MVAPVEVGEGGVALLVGNGLLKRHRAGNRKAVGEAGRVDWEIDGRTCSAFLSPG